MPVIELHGMTLSKEQKESIIKGFTNLTCEVTKVQKETVIVLISEMSPDNIGTGGISVSEIIKGK